MADREMTKEEWVAEQNKEQEKGIRHPLRPELPGFRKVGRPLDYQTPQELGEWIDMYFDECKANRAKDEFKRMLLSLGTDKSSNASRTKLIEKIEKLEKDQPEHTEDVHPTVTGLALYLGMSRMALINYEGREEFIETMTMGKNRVETYLEQRTYHPNNNGVQFNLSTIISF